MLTLILGGARSGKSSYAQSLCHGDNVVYVATAATDDDAEMRRRIARHRQARPAAWRTIEEAENVADAVRDANPHDAPVIVDCVTLWLANLLWKYAALDAEERQTVILDAVQALAETARQRDLIAVSNEVGSGIVPETAVGRQFRDLQGLANQLLVREAGRVVLLVGGWPIVLKDAISRRNATSQE